MRNASLQARMVVGALGGTAIVFMFTWPYGHWIALVLGAIVAVTSRQTVLTLSRGRTNGDATGGIGGGMIEGLRERASARATIAWFVVGASALAVIVQLAGWTPPRP